MSDAKTRGRLDRVFRPQAPAEGHLGDSGPLFGLTNAQRKQAVDLIARKWKNHPCERCGVMKWTVLGLTWMRLDVNMHGAIAEFAWDPYSGAPAPDQTRIGHAPLINFTCFNCGNTRLVNAAVLGVTGFETSR